MTETKVDLITGLTFELTADATAVQESTDPNSVVKKFSDDVEQIAQQIFEAMRFSAQRVNEPQPPEWVPKGNSFMQDHAREVARAILARCGHQPAPPAEKEVGVLVADLRMMASQAARACQFTDAENLSRAADLLEQRHPAPVPAATETRYEFCVYDENYIDQAGGTAPTYAQALSEGRHYLAQYQQDGPHTLELRRIERLPLPAEEVTP